jgi:hypothetical protein
MFEANAGPAPAVGVATTIAYALIVTPAIGTERRQDLRRELVGSWRLVSFEVRNANGSTVAYPFVEDAVGKLTYTADGNMWALARAKSSSAVLWYTGTFQIDPRRRTIHHHVQHGSIAQWEGGHQPRAFKLSGRRLTLSVRPTEPGGTTAVLKWRKSVRSRLAPVLHVRGKWANTNSRFSVEERASRTRS